MFNLCSYVHSKLSSNSDSFEKKKEVKLQLVTVPEDLYDASFDVSVCYTFPLQSPI